jgi:hypothetical protein
MANVRQAWIYECAVRGQQNISKLMFDGGNSGAKKYKRGYGGVWRSLRLGKI